MAGQLAKAEVVEQVVGQPDLFATALELAEVTEAEELFHRRVPRRRIIGQHQRIYGLSFGLSLESFA